MGHKGTEGGRMINPVPSAQPPPPPPPPTALLLLPAFFNLLFLIDCENPRPKIKSVCLECSKCRTITQPVRVAFNFVIMH